MWARPRKAARGGGTRYSGISWAIWWERSSEAEAGGAAAEEGSATAAGEEEEEGGAGGVRRPWSRVEAVLEEEGAVGN